MSKIKIKICGMMAYEDIEAVNFCLPEYIGFVFAEKSRRKLSPNTAKKLKQQLDHRIQTTGVFVNQDIAFIEHLCKDNIIDVIQLHGDEDAEYVKELKQVVNNTIICAVPISDSIPQIPLEADYILFDTASSHYGGTGKTFDWSLLKGFHEKPYFLAGGLDIDNIADAMRILTPYCVDVSSGVETAGKKEKEKIIDFVKTIRRLQHG